MKLSQNDLIISIVAIVLGLGFMTAFYFMKPEPVAPPQPVSVNVTPAALPPPAITYANSLPGGGNNSGMPGGGGGLSAAGGPPPIGGGGAAGGGAPNGGLGGKTGPPPQLKTAN